MSDDPYAAASVSPAIQVLPTAHGVRLILPPRQLGKLRRRHAAGNRLRQRRERMVDADGDASPRPLITPFHHVIG